MTIVSSPEATQAVHTICKHTEVNSSDPDRQRAVSPGARVRTSLPGLGNYAFASCYETSHYSPGHGDALPNNQR